jgi:hypothetical protein
MPGLAYMGARTPYRFAWSAMPKSQKIQAELENSGARLNFLILGRTLASIIFILRRPIKKP